MAKLTPQILAAKKEAETALSNFYLLYSGELKSFKMFSIEYSKCKVALKLSSSKKNDDFIESGTRIIKNSGGNCEN